MSLLRVVASLGLDKTGFDAGMTAAGKQVNKFGSALKSQLAGAFAAAAVVSFVKDTIAAAEAIGDLSDRLGISITDAQEFGLAAKLGGSDVEYLAARVEKLRSYLMKGGDLDIFGLDTKDPIVALKEIAKLVQTVGLTAEQSGKFTDMFGKGAGKMITILDDYKMAKMALQPTDNNIRRAQQLSDVWGVIWHSVKSISTVGLFGPQSAMGTAGRLLEQFGVGRTDGAPKNSNLAEFLAMEEAREKEAADIDVAAKSHMAIQERILGLERDAELINERTRLSKLTAAERLLELKEEELNIAVGKEGVGEEGIFAMRKRLAEIASERSSLEAGVAKKTMGAVDSDQFGRIGAFSGAAGQQGQLDVQRRQLTVLEQMRLDLISRGILIKGTD